MDKISIIEAIRNNGNILSLPQVLAEILTEAGKEDFSADMLAKSILKDPSLTSRILKMVNSPYYHRMAEIKTVNQAVGILGVTTVKCMALSTTVLSPEKIAEESGVDAKEFFTDVMFVAAACEQIAGEVGMKGAEEAFIAGLLHDVGVLFFLHHYPKEYRQIIDKKTSATNLCEAEIEVFGIDHTEVGFHLAEVWGLPPYVAEAIRTHHSPANVPTDDTMSNIVALAVLLTKDHFSGYGEALTGRLTHITTVSESLKLSRETVDTISSSLLAKTIETAEFLGMDIGNIEEILMKANQEIWKSFLTIENLFKERQELTQKLLLEERAKGAEESKNIAMATLSHYLNNAVMAIYGRTQIISMFLKNGKTDKVIEGMPTNIEVINKSVKKIIAVLEEMRHISPLDAQQFDEMSRALNIDDKIELRMEAMGEDEGDLATVLTSSDELMKAHC